MVATVDRSPEVEVAPRRRRRRWRWARRIAGLVVVLGLVLLAPLLWVEWTTTAKVHDQVADVPARRVAIVFGAGIRSDGTPTPFLQHRIDAAIELYRAGKVEKLLMSGDNSTRWHDEVTTMKRYAVAQGVPAGDITLDYAGFDTYDSCFRAKAIFGVREAIVVTTDYHLPRAVYLCNALGIRTDGYGPSEWGREPLDMAYYQGREWLGQYEALIDAHLWHRRPRFLGPKEPSP